MPLTEVRAGMDCTGLSVIRGTDIASFDVEVIDVIAGEASMSGPRILIRASGPAVDATGLGPGFSGSPIMCDGRNAGAVSEGVGEYGNHIALVTPIEEILGAAPKATGARRAPRIARAARPLVGPLTVGGVSTGTRRFLARAARQAGRLVLAAPPGPLGGYPVQDLRPGSSVAAAIATGDVSFGGTGTVAYRDGDRIYAFGHALDGAGRRALFLQDSYVFAVIGNPLAIPDFGAITYKLTSSGGHPLGTFDNDVLAAVTGTLGPGPPSIPLRVTARERGVDAPVRLESLLADERALDLGSGLGFVAPIATSTALERLLGAFEPVTLTVCARFRVRELPRPMGFCNPYFDPFEAMIHVGRASQLVDGFDFAPLHIEDAAVSIAAKRGVIDDVLVDANARRRARRGTRLPVRLTLQRRGGGRRTVTVQVRVPRDVRRGPNTLVLSGTGFASESEIFIEIIGIGLAKTLSGAPSWPARARGAQSGPRTVRTLARRVAAIRRRLGIQARFGRRDEPQLVLRSNRVRFDGKAKVRLLVSAARRR
jgi:hypothetical protein